MPGKLFKWIFFCSLELCKIYSRVVVGSRKIIDDINGTKMISDEIMEAATGETAGSNPYNGLAIKAAI